MSASLGFRSAFPQSQTKPHSMDYYMAYILINMFILLQRSKNVEINYLYLVGQVDFANLDIDELSALPYSLQIIMA